MSYSVLRAGHPVQFHGGTDRRDGVDRLGSFSRQPVVHPDRRRRDGFRPDRSRPERSRPDQSRPDQSRTGAGRVRYGAVMRVSSAPHTDLVGAEDVSWRTFFVGVVATVLILFAMIGIADSAATGGVVGESGTGPGVTSADVQPATAVPGIR